MKDDDNDLTDRYEALTGDTLEDEWRKNPEPPPEYGQPDPRTIVEETANITWVWSSHELDSQILYRGDSVSVTGDELGHRPSDKQSR